MKKNSKSKLLYDQAMDLMPGGVNSPVRAFSPYPFFTKCSKGSKILDVDNNQYIDYCLGYGPLLLGHSPLPVIEAVSEQLQNGLLFGTPTEKEVELAKLICDFVPCAEMVRLVSTGGEATMSAIRAARGYTGKNKILKFEGCYHGAHDSVLVKAGSGATTFGAPDSLGIPEETAKNTIVIPFNDINKLEKTIKENKDELAAVIIEPVVGNVGLILPENDFLKNLREITEKYNIVLIFDEVITGFRLALGGAQEYYGITPDLTTLGKIMGGGLPMAAVVGKKEIMNTFAPSGKVYQAGTFSGNPLSVTASLATLKFLRDRRNEFYAKIENVCKSIVNPLKKTIQDYDLKLQVNQIGSMFQLFFTENQVIDYKTAKTADNKKFMQYHTNLLNNGVFVAPSQFETCFVSNAHSKKDIKKTVNVITEFLIAKPSS